MNAAHVHLIFNHFPLVGFVFSFLVLVIGKVRSNESFVRVGLLIVLISGLFTVPTFLSGDEAYDLLEKNPGFSKELAEEHDQAADFAMVWIVITCLTAGVAMRLSLKKNAAPRAVLMTVIALNLFSLTVIGRTAYLGGKISHPEIRGQ